MLSETPDFAGASKDPYLLHLEVGAVWAMAGIFVERTFWQIVSMRHEFGVLQHCRTGKLWTLDWEEFDRQELEPVLRGPQNVWERLVHDEWLAPYLAAEAAEAAPRPIYMNWRTG